MVFEPCLLRCTEKSKLSPGTSGGGATDVKAELETASSCTPAARLMAWRNCRSLVTSFVSKSTLVGDESEGEPWTSTFKSSSNLAACSKGDSAWPWTFWAAALVR